jgi:GDP-L-fucose synthase
MCENYRRQYGCDFISAMPTNLYGPNDNYDLNNSHVIPALIRKFHEAKTNGSPAVQIWGSGMPLREFLHVDDLAEACLFLMINYSNVGFVNIGSGKEITIKDLALLIGEIVGFTGGITFDASKPDGTPRKLMDSSRLKKLGWGAKIDLRRGLAATYRENFEN